MSYKAIFALTAILNGNVKQINVKTVFLYGNVQETIYVRQLDDFNKNDIKVCKLNKTLYGLKQFPRIGYQHFSKYMKKLELILIESDESVFMNAKKSITIALYVNDILIIDLSKIGIQRIKKVLNDKFHMFDLEPCVYYLDMIVKRDRVVDILRLRQAVYVTRFLKHFNCGSLNPAFTSLKISRKLQSAKESYIASRKLCEDYQFAVGFLMYVMLKTRSDIAYAVSLVSRYLVNSTQTH